MVGRADVLGRPLAYNAKEDILNPHFLVFGDLSRDWTSYQQRYNDIFGDLDASVERAEVGDDKTVWYRLRVGPFASEASAKELCEKLSARGIKTGCLPLRVAR